MKNIETLGIIGNGEFGHLAANRLAPPGVPVRIHDNDPTKPLPSNAEAANLDQVLDSDVVMLAVPFDSYDQLIPEVASRSSDDSLIVDVCSVKIKPTEVFRAHGLLDRENYLLTHPLFGPQSTKEGVSGKNLVITDAAGPKADELNDHWTDSGIKTIEMTADEHDREMARVHVLPFIIGRSLLEMGIEDSPLTTGYFSKLMSLIEVERHHSPELFKTIQQHNPHAANMRSEFISTICALHAEVLIDAMNEPQNPLEQLENLRETLDVIDHYRMVLLGLRFKLTDRVGNLKATHQIPPVDLQRETQIEKELTKDAEDSGVPVELALNIQRQIISEVREQHKAKQKDN